MDTTRRFEDTEIDFELILCVFDTLHDFILCSHSKKDLK